MSAASPPFVFDSEVVRRVLPRLPARQRAALVLRFASGLCEREIATVLGCRPATAHTLLRRAVRRTLQQIERERALDRAAAAVAFPPPRVSVR